MAQFEIGDAVKLIQTDSRYIDAVGTRGTVVSVTTAGLRVRVHNTYGRVHTWHKEYTKNLSKRENESMSDTTKYFRVIKEHPLWEVGAIISNEKKPTSYSPVVSVWNKFDDMETWTEGATLVEQQDEWFERVYPLGKLEKMVFGDKKQAQAAASALYKGDKKAK